MAKLRLPHTAGCMGCGPQNPHGLRMLLDVDSQTGQVEADFVADESHFGFVGIVHGGVIATMLDEAMAWAATWAARRFCFGAELNVRYRSPAPVGRRLRIRADVAASRPRLIQCTGQVVEESGTLIATAEAKFMPLPLDRHMQFVNTLVPTPQSQAAMDILMRNA